MKIFVITKKTGIIYSLILIFLVAVIYVGKTRTALVANPQRELPIYCVEKDENDRRVAFSFDAAWGNEDTETLIEILGKYNIKATFFVVGGWVDKYPESVKALSDAGHEIMNHSDTHPHMTGLSAEEIKKEVESCDEKIKSITGKTPTLFRAPYGDYDDKVVSTLRELNHYTIQWDVDSLDWKELPAEEITQRVVEKVCPGSIVLFHNAAVNTPEALPQIIEKLQSDGYSIVPISELILTEDYHIDVTGKQIPNAADETAAPTESADAGAVSPAPTDSAPAETSAAPSETSSAPKEE